MVSLLTWRKNLRMKILIRGFFYLNILLVILTILLESLSSEPSVQDIEYFADYSSWFFVLLGMHGYLQNKKYFSIFFWKSFVFLLVLWEGSIIIRVDQFFIIENNMDLFLILFNFIFVVLEVLTIYLYIKSDIWSIKDEH